MKGYRMGISLFAITFILAIGIINTIPHSSTLNLVQNNTFIKNFNNTETYIQNVNMSAYLIFYPNLKQAYTYLNLSKITYSTNPQKAYKFLNMSFNSASTELHKINSYKEYSLIVMIILSILSGIVLYKIMKHENTKRNVLKQKIYD